MTNKRTFNRIGTLALSMLLCATLAACGNTTAAPSVAAPAVPAAPAATAAPAAPVATPAPIKKAVGGDVENSVFFIAVQEAADGETKFYYYSREELEALETQSAYSYNDHSVDKTVTCKGAALGTLIAGLEGVNITDDMVVQYAEEDGYHADAKTPVENSDYKDTVASLSQSVLAPDGSTKPSRNSIVTYLIHEEYAKPDAFNQNDPEGVFKDADDNSGFLRVYRDTGNANNTVLKYIVGIAISPSGDLLSGEDGCTVKAVSSKDAALALGKDRTIQGLLPGMSYAVKAPKLDTAVLAEGEADRQVVTIAAGVDTPVVFSYTEGTYLSVKNGDTTKDYTLTDLQKISTQVPPQEGNTAPYGYLRPMYYRYNGVQLGDLLKDTATAGKTVTITAADGSKLTVDAAKLGDYFIAYEESYSKSSTNIPEGKRKTTGYLKPQIILPASAENITGSAVDDYTEKGSAVTVAMADAVLIEIEG